MRARARVGVRAVRGSGRQRQASLRSDQVLSRDRGKAVVLLRSRHDAAAAIEARRGGGERRPTVTLLPLPGRVAPPRLGLRVRQAGWGHALTCTA